WSVLGRDVLDARECTASIIVAIGDNAARRRVTNELVGTRCKPATIIHPTACISTHATLGAGVYIGPGAIVNAQATIGDGAIINSGAIVEHHAHIGAFAHIAPGATLGGNVAVGDLGLVGLNATIKPNTRLGTRCTIGAGAVVIRDVPDDQTVVGVPAKASR